MKKILFTIVLIFITASFSYAQTPTTGKSQIGWDQEAPTLAEAQGYIYKYYADDSATGITLVSVTCSGATSPFLCQVAFPAFTPGPHNLVLTASNLAGESLKSSPPLTFKFVVTPATPGNVRIIGG